MNVTSILTYLMLAAFAAGALDYVLRGRLGLSEEFEKGIMAAGRLTLCMAGFIVLAPLIARVLGPAVAPLFRQLGIDPSIIAGMLLANDCGGAALAAELADDAQAGQFSGMIVGSMLGTTIMLTIPTVMACTDGHERTPVIYGIVCGIITIPAGCLAGGLLAGFPFSMVVLNTLPVLFLSSLLAILMKCLSQKMVPAFSVFGRLLTAVSIFGLVCGAVENLTGWQMLPGMGTLAYVFPLVGSISVYLAGAFVLLAAVRRLFASGLSFLGGVLKINAVSMSAMLLVAANALPPIMMLRDMDDRGRMLNAAFLVSAACIFGDHLAFTAQMAPELCLPVVAAKAVGGFSALGLTLLYGSKYFPGTSD